MARGLDHSGPNHQWWDQASRAPPDPMPFLAVLGLAAFASAFSLRVVDPMLNILAADLKVSLQHVALLASAFTLPYATMQLFFGPIGDAVGKVRLVRFNLSMLAVGLALSAVATGDDMLLVTRAISGAFAGGIIPVVLATVGDRVPSTSGQRR